MKGGVRLWNSEHAFCWPSFPPWFLWFPLARPGGWKVCSGGQGKGGYVPALPWRYYKRGMGHLRHIFSFTVNYKTKQRGYVPQELSPILPFAYRKFSPRLRETFYSAHLVNSSLHAQDVWKNSTAQQSTHLGAILPCFKSWLLSYTALYLWFNFLTPWMKFKYLPHRDHCS